jgi:hypothetical protein
MTIREMLLRVLAEASLRGKPPKKGGGSDELR